MRVFKILIIVMTLISCESDKDKIRRLISSDNKDEVVKGYYLIGEQRDRTFITDVFTNPYDPRISHHIKFKGISVYQSKMIAMKKITEMEPPSEITYKPDTAVVNFYYTWAKEEGYINE
ncbi:hypothetical protein [Fulvivirga imtechensis]|nr:hypothetical protein [Fulvivirga imtechensis]